MAVMTAIMIGSLIASTVSHVVASKKAANAAKRAGAAQQEAANSQAELQDWNANVADLQGKDAIARGVESESRFRSGVDIMVGQQRAAAAGANIDVGFGSALDVQADAAYLGELDALTIRTNAAREAWGYKVQGQDLRRRAEITRKEGVNAVAAGNAQASAANWQIAGTIATGAGDAGLLAQRYGFGSSSRTSIPTIRSTQYVGRTLTGPRLG